MWENHPDEMSLALKRHDELLRAVIEDQGGYVFKTVGDAFCAAFSVTRQAVETAFLAQKAVLAESWPEATPIKVRMAIHTGAVGSRAGDYIGRPLHRIARLLSTGHGSQILLSQVAHDMVVDALPKPFILSDKGEHTLRDLGRPERIYQVVHPELPSDFPELRTLDNTAMKHNLIQQWSSFVGREKELEETQSLIQKTRLLTLTGAGGSGKTRLALQLAAEQLEAFADGVWLVELASLSDPAQVPHAVAAVLGAKETPGKPIAQTLEESLKDRQCLIILDNCEHVLDACADLTTQLITRSPSIKVLATSREGMNVPGEQTYRVPSLSLPTRRRQHTKESVSQYDSVQLFVDRASAARGEFELTEENAAAVASLCLHLDGIPLAIELAAARIRSMSIEEIAAKLDQRFRLLTTGSRAALPRHQTLRALVDWSYQLLEPLERDAFEQLSVFVGGWDIEMADAVCGDTLPEFESLDIYATLVEKSLMNFEPGEGGRYTFYETIRQFAREQLAGRPEVESGALKRHAEFMAEYGLRNVRRFRTADEQEALLLTTRNSANLSAAIGWARGEQRSDLVAMLALALGATLQRNGYPRDGTGLIEEAISQVETGEEFDQEIMFRLLCERATLALDLLETDVAEPYAIRARELSDNLDALEFTIRSENLLGQIAMAKNDFAESRRHYTEALKLGEKSKNWVEMARMRNNLGIVERRDPNGDNDVAVEHYRAALEIQRSQKHTRGEAETLNSLGVLEQTRKNFTEAARLYLEAAQIEVTLEHPFGVAKTLSNYGEALAELGDHEGSLGPLAVAEQIFDRIRSPYRDYTKELLDKSAQNASRTPEQIRTLRDRFRHIDLKDAISASLQLK